MQTFKQYLDEAKKPPKNAIKPWKTDEQTVKKAIALLNSRFRTGLKAIEAGGLLFRGDDRMSGDFVIVDPSTGLRTSRDSNNGYQVLMNATPAMRGYPSRMRSLIGTSNALTAYGYSGNVYVIVPVDGAKIVVSDAEDFLRDYDFDTVSELLYASCKQLKVPMTKPWIKLDPSFRTRLNDSREYDDRNKPTDHWKIIGNLARIGALIGLGKQTDLASELAETKDKYAWLTSVLTPENLDLELLSFGETLPRDVECWTDAKCMLIRDAVFYDMLKQLVESGSIKPHFQSRAFMSIMKTEET